MGFLVAFVIAAAPVEEVVGPAGRDRIVIHSRHDVSLATRRSNKPGQRTNDHVADG